MSICFLWAILILNNKSQTLYTSYIIQSQHIWIRLTQLNPKWNSSRLWMIPYWRKKKWGVLYEHFNDIRRSCCFEYRKKKKRISSECWLMSSEHNTPIKRNAKYAAAELQNVKSITRRKHWNQRLFTIYWHIHSAFAFYTDISVSSKTFNKSGTQYTIYLARYLDDCRARDMCG